MWQRGELRYILAPHGLSEAELEDILDPWEDPTCSGPHLLPVGPAEDFLGESEDPSQRHRRSLMATTLYTLEVCLIEGPVTDGFVEANPSVVRTIEIWGDQTLEDLHDAIFEAFDRWEQHMYEFQLGSGPHDPDGDRYVISLPFEMPEDPADDRKPAGEAAEATIASLELEVGRYFGYWFDFGDNWYHQIQVLAVGDAEPEVSYPRVIARVGDSPPQYADWDEDE